MEDNIIKKTADDFEKALNTLTTKSGTVVKSIAFFVLKHKRMFIAGFFLYLLGSYFLKEEE